MSNNNKDIPAESQSNSKTESQEEANSSYEFGGLKKLKISTLGIFASSSLD